MLEKIVEAAVSIKLPSIVIIIITFWAGVNLVSTDKNQAALLAGCGLLGVGGIAVILSFADNLVKERYESIINHYDKALRNISKTHSTIEETSRNNMLSTSTEVNQQIGDRTYSREHTPTTPTR